MNCQNYHEKIGPLLMEDLEPDERIQLEQHLASCPDCRQERDLLSETLDQLSSLQEAALPNHFFVQPEQPRLGLLQLLSRLSPLWKGVFAMLALAILAGAALAVSGLQVRVDEGALMAGFGSLPASRPAGLDQEQAAALVSDLLQMVERRIQERDAALTIALHSRISSFRVDLEQEKQQGLETLLTDFEQRLARFWQDRDNRLRLEVRNYVESASGDVQVQYRRDLARLGLQLEEFAVRDDIQDERISLVSSAFLKIVEGTE